VARPVSKLVSSLVPTRGWLRSVATCPLAAFTVVRFPAR
jgi:hypothetical protein